MGKRILLIEPYVDLADMIGFYLEELGYQFDLVTDATMGEEDFTKSPYECVLINLDQNSDEWRNFGLCLAERASRAHLPVVMIADHEVAAATISANGWKSVRKPFTVAKLESAITEAVGA
jgi:DNA-binding response OmpR family regulator